MTRKEPTTTIVVSACPTAILVDGGFFLKRYPHLFKDGSNHDAKTIVKNLFTMALKHAEQDHGELYRILFYDCRPFDKKIHHPITKKFIKFGETNTAKLRNEVHSELKRKRKVAIRLGHIRDGDGWVIRKHKIKELLANKIAISDLAETDIYYDLEQKGVDMKIGLDIASLSYKKLVRRIVLIAGDTDFVPAAKLARREGIDFILDPLWNHINDDLFEHIDGLRSMVPKPTRVNPTPRT